MIIGALFLSACGNIEGGSSTYSVTYFGTGGTPVPTDSNQYTSGKTLTINDGTLITRSGYNFAGWSTSPGGPLIGGTLSVSSENITLYASWSEQVVATQVITFTGTANTPGSNDGTGTGAQFNYPNGIAIDSYNNIYITDTSNHIIRRITPDGVVSTFAGTTGVSGTDDGNGSAAEFNSPHGITVDSSNNIYIADYGNHTIRKITIDGDVTTIAGTAGTNGHSDNTGTDALFRDPVGIVADTNGNLFVTEFRGKVVRKLTPGAGGYEVTTIAGIYGTDGIGAEGIGTSVALNRLYDITIDASGNLYLPQYANGIIRKLEDDNDDGIYNVTTISGIHASLGIDDGTHDGGDSVWQTGEARFRKPSGIVFDASGNLYVTDEWADTIRKLTPDSGNYIVTTYAGLGDNVHNNSSSDPKHWDAGSLVNGALLDARFNGPKSMAFDSLGNLYVVDKYNHVIRKIGF